MFPGNACMPYDQQGEVRILQTLARKVENKYQNRCYLTKGYSGGSNNIRQINKLDSFRRKTASRSGRKVTTFEKRSVLHPKTSEHACRAPSSEVTKCTPWQPNYFN